MSPRTAGDPKVLIIDAHPETYLDGLRPHFPDVRFVSGTTYDEVDEHLGDTEVLVTLGVGVGRAGADLTEQLVARMPALSWVQSLAAGYDHFVRALAGRDDVLLTTARGMHGAPASETVLLHMLALARQVRRVVHNQDGHVWDRFPPALLDGKAVAVVGLGVIGNAVVSMCKALGMTVYGVSRGDRGVGGLDGVYDRSELVRIAAAVDFLVLTLRLEAETELLVGREVLESMKPTSFLINVARGRIVDEGALITALRTGSIAGAGLDVFADGRLSPSSPLWDMPNVFVTPHVGGLSDRYAHDALRIVEPNLRRYLSGDTDDLTNLVGIRDHINT